MPRASGTRGLVVTVVLMAVATGCAVREIQHGERLQPEQRYSKIRFFRTGDVSLNDTCPMTGLPIHPARPPVYVNGRPIGFC